MKRQLFIPAAITALLTCPTLWAQEPVIANPGFEQGLARWSHWSESPGTIVQATGTVAKESSQSLHLSNMDAEGKGRMMVFQSVQNVEPNTIYNLSASIKSDASPLGSVRVGLKLEFYNADGVNTSGVNSYASLVQGADWETVSSTAVADAEAISVRVYLRLFTRGSVYFDNVELSRPEVLLDEPTRLIHIPGEPLEARLIAWAMHDGDALPGFVLQATHHGKTTLHQPAVERLEDKRYALTATLPAIEEGHYDLNVVLDGSTSPRPARTYPSPKVRKPTRLSDTGTLLHHGKPFFPIGMYHPHNHPHYKMGGTADGAKEASRSYALLAAHGFNAVQGSNATDLDKLGADLDIALKHGLAVDVPFYANNQVGKNLPVSLEKIARFKRHPAVLNWKISDEPDIRPEVADEVPGAYHAFKSADADTPVEITLATDYALGNWAQFADIIQIDRYPIPGGKLTAVSDFTRLAMQNKAPWQNVSFVVQCGWSADLSNQPSVAEARCMVYLALIEGAKGIWWYSMYDPGWDLTTTPLWPEMKAINEEIRQLSAPLMLGEELESSSTNSKVSHRALKHDGKLYLLVTNPEATSQAVTITLSNSDIFPEGYTPHGEPAGVSANDGSVALKLGPLDSCALVFSY